MTRVGVLGGGQLGRMLAQAAAPLGIECVATDENPDACAGQVTELMLGSLADEAFVDRFASSVDVVTYEHENVPLPVLTRMGQRTRVAPGTESLRLSQDRLLERSMFSSCAVGQAEHAPVSDESSLADAVARVGLPGILKRRVGGYDGRGQARLRESADALDAWSAIDRAPAMYEAFVPFDRELSIVGARSHDGEIAFYPLVQSVHAHGILIQTVAPAPGLTDELQASAEAMATRIVESLGHVGTFALELFEVGGELLANELASRVHNTGHWTIEGAETSQFENHIRAIVGMPLGSTTHEGQTVMVNLLGRVPDDLAAMHAPGDGIHVHAYGKGPKPRRKVGHVTVHASDADELHRRWHQVAPRLDEGAQLPSTSLIDAGPSARAGDRDDPG